MATGNAVPQENCQIPKVPPKLEFVPRWLSRQMAMMMTMAKPMPTMMINCVCVRLLLLLTRMAMAMIRFMVL